MLLSMIYIPLYAIPIIFVLLFGAVMKLPVWIKDGWSFMREWWYNYRHPMDWDTPVSWDELNRAATDAYRNSHKPWF